MVPGNAGLSNTDGCLFKRFAFIFPDFAVQEFFAKSRVDSEEFTSNTGKVQEMCKIKAQLIRLKKGSCKATWPSQSRGSWVRR